MANTEQDKQAAANLAHNLVDHSDAGAAYALHDGSHAYLAGSERRDSWPTRAPPSFGCEAGQLAETSGMGDRTSTRHNNGFMLLPLVTEGFALNDTACEWNTLRSLTS